MLFFHIFRTKVFNFLNFGSPLVKNNNYLPSTYILNPSKHNIFIIALLTINHNKLKISPLRYLICNMSY